MEFTREHSGSSPNRPSPKPADINRGGPVLAKELFTALERTATDGPGIDNAAKHFNPLLNRPLQIGDAKFIGRSILGAGSEGVVLLAERLGIENGPLIALKISHVYLSEATSKKPQPVSVDKYQDPLMAKASVGLEAISLQHALSQGIAPQFVPKYIGTWEGINPASNHLRTRATAMEVVKGEQLESFIERELFSLRNERLTLQALSAISGAVLALHKAGLYCGDPFPNNFLLATSSGDRMTCTVLDHSGVIPIKADRYLCPAGMRETSAYLKLLNERESRELRSFALLSTDTNSPGMLIKEIGYCGGRNVDLSHFKLLQSQLAVFKEPAKDLAQFELQVKQFQESVAKL